MRDRLEYDPETGLFRWRHVAGRGARNDLAGQVAGSPHKDGYIAIQIGRKKHMAHRLAWFFSTGEWPTGEIDHVNGIRTDNRLANLRDVSKSVNLQNQRPNGRSLGVDFYKARAKWRARISVSGVSCCLGYFESESESEAQAAYINAKRERHEGCTI